MRAIGVGTLDNPKVPTPMARMPGAASMVQVTCVPQVVQNSMRSQRPVSSERCS